MATTQTLLNKIVKIQSQLRAPKNQYNSFGKYNYRSQEDILEALKPLLEKEGVMQTITDHVRMIGDRYYIEASVSVRDVTSGEEMTVTAYAREPQSKKGMDESQVTGTASSYARKYALNGMWLIDDTKDADTDEHTYQQRSAKKSSPIQNKNDKQEDNRKWLNEGTQDWTNAEQKMQSGEITIADLFKHYKLSKAAQEYFRSLNPNT